MMFDVELVLVVQVIIDASLAEHRVDAVVLAEEDVAELLLALVFRVL